MSFFKNVKIMGVNALIRVYFRIHIYALNMFLTIHTICMTDEHMNCPPPFFFIFSPCQHPKGQLQYNKKADIKRI